MEIQIFEDKKQVTNQVSNFCPHALKVPHNFIIWLFPPHGGFISVFFSLKVLGIINNEK